MTTRYVHGVNEYKIDDIYSKQHTDTMIVGENIEANTTKQLQ